MIKLRPYKRCDAQYITGWIHDERTFRMWSADRYDSFPITADDMNAMYDGRADADDFFPFTAFDENGVLGHLVMRYPDSGDRSHVRFGFVIVDNSRRGTGCGTRMLRVALRYAFDILGAERVSIVVFDCNSAARRCYESVGFRQLNPVTRTFCYHDESWDCIELEILRDWIKN